MTTGAVLRHRGGFRQVVIATGHVTDRADRKEPRFPESAVPRVEQEVANILRSWRVGPDDLLVGGGARGADTVVAEQAAALGAAIWTLLAHSPAEFLHTSVEGGDPSWIERYWRLLQRHPSWERGDDPAFASREDPYRATNEWMLQVVATQAEPSAARVIAVWDGQPGQGEGGAADMVAAARGRGLIVEIVSPLPSEPT